MNHYLSKTMLKSIVNFYCNILGFNHNTLKYLEKEPILNIYDAKILVQVH